MMDGKDTCKILLMIFRREGSLKINLLYQPSTSLMEISRVTLQFNGANITKMYSMTSAEVDAAAQFFDF
jgi:hypothetical protein